MKTGAFVFQFENGKYGFVGSVSAALMDIGPASKADVLAQRCIYEAGRLKLDADGNALAYKPKTFASEYEARTFAAAQNVELLS